MGKLPGGLNGNNRIVTNNFHTQGHGAIRHPDPDCAQTDDSEAFAEDFGAFEVRLALFDELGNFVALPARVFAQAMPW